MISATGCLPSRLRFLIDRNSGCSFFIYTDAEVNPIHCQSEKQARLLDPCAVNGYSITIFGARLLILDLGLHRTF